MKFTSILLFLIATCSLLSAQDVTVRYFNAEWNAANNVTWCHTKKKGLTDCKVSTYDIGKDAAAQKKYAVYFTKFGRTITFHGEYLEKV